jgi:hypothetical protein
MGAQYMVGTLGTLASKNQFMIKIGRFAKFGKKISSPEKLTTATQTLKSEIW